MSTSLSAIYIDADQKDVKRDLDVFFKKEEIRQIIIDEKKKMLMNECGQRREKKRKCILKLAPTINQSKIKINQSVSQSVNQRKE